ncbi:hypothetical protein [Salipiger mucosus]|uniref:Uncharacterized protein n=1 Tax=Salipiger mucosus DSM 16094 TaxID=1123237 RepID=S9QZM4_9RHOB|nr:hypothetical protein [Salipiger mucosus]EPX85108.1 hypothetical protein Salmuc_01064 [Salipiger mucosus DSM 16094]
MGMMQHPTGLPMKPEQTFFKDPAIDRLLAMIMTMAAELNVTRDRLATMEMLMAEGKPVTPQALDAFEPTPEQAETLAAARQSFSDELMFCTLGIEASLGAPEDGVDQFNKE